MQPATFILRDAAIRENCTAYIRALPEWQLWEVRIAKPQKSRAQENYWHMLIGRLSAHTGEDADDLKMRLKLAWLPLHEVVASGKVHLLPPSTSKLTKDDYSKLIEKTLLIFDALNVAAPSAVSFGLDEQPRKLKRAV